MYRIKGIIGSTPAGDRFLALKQWAEDEMKTGNRLKASRINKVAERLRPYGLVYYPRPARPPMERC